MSGFVAGHCPACGQETLVAEQVPDPHGTIGDWSVLRCWNRACPRPSAPGEILGDPEIHHIVRFDSASGTFNVKHPLRERIGGELLDCAIHDEVQRWYVDEQERAFGDTPHGTYRLKRRDDVPGEESNEWPWLWEKM